MSTSDGTRRFTTYGKRKTHVAVSRRDWWSAVSEAGGSAASTSSLEQDSRLRYGTDGTSPLEHAARKASTVIELDEDDDHMPAVRKQVPLPRAQSRSTNTRSRIVDLADDSSSDSDEEYKPSRSTSSQASSSAVSQSLATAETPANRALKQTAKAPDQQRRRVISLSSDTSEENKIRPARRKTAASMLKAAKRIVIGDTSPVSPERELPQAVHVPDLQDVEVAKLPEVPLVNTSAISTTASPAKVANLPKPAVLSRKDSNHITKVSSAASSPLKKQASKTSTLLGKASEYGNENSLTSSKINVSAFKQALPAKALQTPLTTTSRHPSLPSGVSVATGKSRSSSSKSSSSSSSASISLPPPRGHHSGSAVSWRRPLLPVIPASATNTRPSKTLPNNLAAPRQRTNVSVMSDVTRKLDTASPVRIRSTMPVTGHQSSRCSHVVVEVPFGLPRSRSPAPATKEPRRRQASSQSTASTISTTSTCSSGARPRSPSPLPPSMPTETQISEPSTSSGIASGSDLSLDATDDEDQSASDTVPNTAVPRAAISSTRGSDVPEEFVPLLDHCDGFTSTSPAEILDFASFVAQPSPLFPASIALEEGTAKWSKLGEATFSEVFIVSDDRQKADKNVPAGIVVKVIPLHMSPLHMAEEEKVEEAFAKADDKVEDVSTSSISDLTREIRIFRSLSNQDETARRGWPGFKGAYLVRGTYPETLLAAWDSFKMTDPKRAENPRPDTFAANQVYALICMEHAGTDLESVKLKSWSEAAAILWQVSLALTEAERSLHFEHRDLHWGNILVRRHTSDLPGPHTLESDLPDCLASVAAPLSATIIDFTLSRASVPRSSQSPADGQRDVLSGGFEEEWMFTGEGDYQYECYRIMKRLVQNRWEEYRPVTNLVWLHYLVKKLLYDKNLKKPAQRSATRSVAMKANLPGTPVRSRTRRGTVLSKRGVKPATATENSCEKNAYESLLAAEGILGEAIAVALKSLPRSTSLIQMMENMHVNAADAGENAQGGLQCAGDFVDWWREA